jgi:hypothetical protein
LLLSLSRIKRVQRQAIGDWEKMFLLNPFTFYLFF